MFAYNAFVCTVDESNECQHDKINVVDLPDKRENVRDEIDG